MLVTVTVTGVGRSNQWRQQRARKRNLSSTTAILTGMCMDTPMRKQMVMDTVMRRTMVMDTAMVDTVTDTLLTQRRVDTA